MQPRDSGVPIALVTGANKGIGQEIARQLAARGCHVVLSARDPRRGRDATERLAAELPSAKVSFLVMDVTDKSSVRAAANEFARLSDRLDVLVNNAAILLDEGLNILQVTPEMFDETMRTNVRGPLLVAQAFWPFLERTRGRIINISSMAGAMSMPAGNIPAYGISKAALNNLTQKLATTGTASGVLCFSMCPGWVRTDMGGPNAERPVSQGADTATWLALDAPRERSGRFFRDRQEIAW
jgi:NAD(P)-dependent dehydrogenase (short-subunit alcohol dehydrogenase family)